MKKLKKYSVIMFSFLIILMISIPSGIKNTDMNTKGDPKSQSDVPFRYGVTSIVNDLDPQFMWDSASSDLATQVMEGLFHYDVASFNYSTDAEVAITPLLASAMGTWSTDGLEYSVDLKHDVTFHDGSAFTAADVVFTFERLNSLCTEGALMEEGDTEKTTTQIATLYMPLEGKTVIKTIEAITDYQVKFTLNYPYVPFESLLCFSGSVILNENNVPVGRYYSAATDILDGTGPYYIYELGVESAIIKVYEGYHRSLPEIRQINFIKYSDSIQINQALLNREIDMVNEKYVFNDLLIEFEGDPSISVEENRKNTVIIYLGMNNKMIDFKVRKAITKAMDYEYLWNEMGKGDIAPMTSVVPEGILYHNPDMTAPEMNVTAARELIIEYCNDEGISLQELTIESSDADWFMIADGDTPLFSYNYTYNVGNIMRGDVGTLIKDTLRYIGIEVDIKGVTWSEFLTCLLGEFDRLELFMIGWMPDYNDPSNYVDSLLSNTSRSNGAQVNDPTLQTMLEDALTETNRTQRRLDYYAIQEYITDDLCPWVYLYVGTSQNVYNIGLGNFPQNPLNKLYFYPCTWNPPADSDGDGLYDILENDLYGTNPNDPDTDNDGYSDGIEVQTGSDPLDENSTPPDCDNDGIADIVDQDIDGDGFPNDLEADAGTDPYNSNDYPQDSDGDGILDFIDNDIDGDGFPNELEEYFGTDPYNPNDFPQDSDGDGLADSYEELIGTDIYDKDTDDDGYIDSIEIGYMLEVYGYYEASDPLDPYSFPEDFDQDFLTDVEEYFIYGTNPTICDSDNDGLIDGLEVHTYGTNPKLVDSDYDGLSDAEEINDYGTDPMCIDSDNDNFNDAFEIKIRCDPLDPNDYPDAPTQTTTETTTETTTKTTTDNTTETNTYNNFNNIPGYSFSFLLVILGLSVYVLIKIKKIKNI